MANVRSHPLAPLRLRLAPHLVLAACCAGLASALRVDVPAGATAGGCVAVAIAATAATLAGRAGPALALVAVAALVSGVAWGEARLAATATPALDLPAPVRGTVLVDSPPVPDGSGGRRARAVGEALAGPRGAVPPGTGLLLELPPDDPSTVGARLRVVGVLRPAAGPTAPGWWRRWLARQGIAGRLRPATIAREGRRGGPAGLRDRWREWAGREAAAGLSGDRGALVRGLALGGGSGLSEGAADAFRDAGIWHLLAVSGQNVTVVAVVTLAALTALGVRRRPAVAVAAGVMVAYCLACDGGPSVARAGIVGGLGLLAELRSADRERWYLLLAGLTLLLAHQPRALADPGLQLSFSAVAGLFTLAGPLTGWLTGVLPARIAGLAGMAGAASLATAPVVVAHFGRMSIAGLAVNVVAVPLAAPIVVLALAGLAAGAVLPAAGVALAALAGVGAAALLVLASTAAAVPGAAVDLPALAALPLAVVAAGLATLSLMLRPGGPRLGPAVRWWRPALVAAVAVLVGGGVLLGRDRPPPWPARPALTALDVGQGDAILLRSPEGAAALVDAGPPGDPPAVVRALRRLGVRRLDALVLTHDSLDHVGGAPDVLRRMEVGVVMSPREPVDGWGPPGVRALAAAREHGVPARVLTAGDAVAVGEWRLRTLSPAGARPVGADPNPWSLVALARAGDLDALLTGDAESDALARLPAGRVDVLKVSHHGSEDPGLDAVLDRLRPRVALISAGRGNSFGHPRAPTLASLAAAGARTWRTDLSGDVTVTGAGAAPAVLTGR